MGGALPAKPIRATNQSRSPKPPSVSIISPLIRIRVGWDIGILLLHTDPLEPTSLLVAHSGAIGFSSKEEEEEEEEMG